MTNDDITRFKSERLPASTKALMDFDCLNFTEQRILDSLYIMPSPSWTAFGPEGDLFEYPLQITILGIEGDRVKLGIYKHLSLLLKQGPLPNKQWRRMWEQGMEFPGNTLPELHAGKVATGFAILGNTLFIDDVRAFDSYLGVPDELLANYIEPDRDAWEMYTCGPHPDFSYEISEIGTVPEEQKTGVEIEMWFNKKRFSVTVISNVSHSKRRPRSITLAEGYLPQYAEKLKELMNYYYISTIKPTFRWIK